MATIWGKYRNNAVERIDSADTMREANRLLAEYRMAFAANPGQHESGNWILWIGKKYPIPGSDACRE